MIRITDVQDGWSNDILGLNTYRRFRGTRWGCGRVNDEILAFYILPFGDFLKRLWGFSFF